MSMSSRKARGRKTQRIVRDYLIEHGFPHAQSVGASEPGRDILGLAGLSCEVKATSDGPLLAGLRQAIKYGGGDLPLVVWRPDGYGEEKVAEWVVAFQLKDAVTLLREAGYGEPIPTEDPLP